MLFPALLVLLLVILFQTTHKYRILNQKRVAVYHVNQHSAIDFIHKDKHVLLADSVLLAEDYKLGLPSCQLPYQLGAG